MTYINHSKLNFRPVFGKNKAPVQAKKMPYKFRTNTLKRADVIMSLSHQVGKALTTDVIKQYLVALLKTVPVVPQTKYTMKERTIWIWEQEYTVSLPESFDIYQGLRLFYPDLYEEALKEQEYINYQQDIDNEIIDRYLDYQEWLCD